jgi:hypothetical protein
LTFLQLDGRSNGIRKQLKLLMALHEQPASTIQQVTEVSNESEKNP